MKVSFIKESPEKYRLECVREDGSKTIASLEFRGYFRHDLLHLVVEHAANLQNSFFGFVKAGRNLDELSPKAIKESAAIFPDENQTTETVVGALHGPFNPETDFREVCLRLREYLEMMSMVTPDYLTPEFCQRVTEEHRSLMGRWGQLRGGECLEFIF